MEKQQKAVHTSLLNISKFAYIFLFSFFMRTHELFANTACNSAETAEIFRQVLQSVQKIHKVVILVIFAWIS